MAQTASSYNIQLANDGSGNFTPTVIRNYTSGASGGTAVSLPFTENNNTGVSTGKGTITTLLPGVAIQAALRAVVNDIASGN